MSEPTRYTIFMLVRTTPAWLALPPPARFRFVDEALKPILQRHPGVRLRFFDGEAFNSRVSDVLVWETTALDAYSSLVEGLRETPFWGHYFEIHYGVAPAAE